MKLQILLDYENKNFVATLRRSGVRGGRYSPGSSSGLTQIVPYSSSLYTVFHSVIYNSVDHTYRYHSFQQISRAHVLSPEHEWLGQRTMV